MGSKEYVVFVSYYATRNPGHDTRVVVVNRGGEEATLTRHLYASGGRYWSSEPVNVASFGGGTMLASGDAQPEEYGDDPWWQASLELVMSQPMSVTDVRDGVRH